MPGGRLGDISAAIGAVGHAAGHGIPLEFGGHGIGHAMHEDPHVPNSGRPARGLRLVPGLVIAIEPWFLAGGKDECRIDSNGWTVRSTDGSRAAHVEHTVAVTDDGPVVLTASPCLLGLLPVTATVTRPVRIGVQLHPQHSDYKTIRRAASDAEDLGADILFNWDHFFPLYGEPEGKHFECWTMLGAWAESTSRAEIGALVSCNSYRNPDLLADMARTVDHISDGRLILGIGAGWCQKDYDEYGYEFGTAGSRIDDLAEALPRIEARLAKLNPAPTRKIPVMVGGGGEKKTLRLVAKHADIWHSFGDAGTLERKLGILRQHCADVGRDPAEIEISVGVESDPEEVGAGLRALGASLFTLEANGPDYDMGPLRAWLAWRDAQNS